MSVYATMSCRYHPGLICSTDCECSPPADTARKAAAFDWLMARLQESHDGRGWVEAGDVSVGANMMWGHREERLVKAEIQWKDTRDEPLDLLSAIERAMQDPTPK